MPRGRRPSKPPERTEGGPRGTATGRPRRRVADWSRHAPAKTGDTALSGGARQPSGSGSRAESRGRIWAGFAIVEGNRGGHNDGPSGAQYLCGACVSPGRGVLKMSDPPATIAKRSAYLLSEP